MIGNTQFYQSALDTLQTVWKIITDNDEQDNHEQVY